METIIEKVNSQCEEVMLSHLQTVIGLWVNGNTYWLFNQTEKIMTKEKLTVKVKHEHTFSKVRHSHIYITNHSTEEIQVKLILKHQYNRASRDHLSFVSPSEKVIFHLADKKVFLVNGQFEDQSIQQATIQPYWNMNTNQIWNCPNKGVLRYQPMSKGLAISLFTFHMCIPPNVTKNASTWTIQGESKAELLNVNRTLLKKHTSISF
jgi:hypothetical protein